MKVFIVASVALILTSCTGTLDSGAHSVRNVEEASLQGQTIGTVLEMLGSPDAYYAVPGGREQILTYDTAQQHYPEPTPIGCGLVMGLGGGFCSDGNRVYMNCVAFRFGPDKRLVDIDRSIFNASPCSGKSDDRFLPATRRPLEAISQ